MAALGCTEPIAIVYIAAKARRILGCIPDRMVAKCSGNIINNVKGIIVPTTKNMKGIETGAILGAVAGDPDKKLEVLSEVKEEDIEKTRELLLEKMCTVELAERVENLAKAYAASGSDARVSGCVLLVVINSGSGAAIAYLNGASYEIISKTIVNTLTNTSGIVRIQTLLCSKNRLICRCSYYGVSYGKRR